MDESTGLQGINVSPDAFPTFYQSDPYGVLTSEEAEIRDGVLIVSTSNGDSFGTRNDNADAYGMMLDTSSTEKFTVTSKVIMPDEGLPQASAAAIGMQIGDGSQASYIKFTRSYGGGGNRFEVRWDSEDSLMDAVPGSSATRQSLAMTETQSDAVAYRLSLDIDRSKPDSIWVSPIAIALDVNDEPIGDAIVGSTFRVTGPVADAINGQNQSLATANEQPSSGGLFVGVYSTDYSNPFNRVPSFIARWDDLSVISRDPPPVVVELSESSDLGWVSNDRITSRNNGGIESALDFDVTGASAGDLIELYANGVLIGSAIATGSSLTVTTDGTSELADGSYSLVARRIVPGFVQPVDSSPIELTIDSRSPELIFSSLDAGISVSDLEFSVTEPVQGLDLSDLTLSIDGFPISWGTAELIQVESLMYRIEGLDAISNDPGRFDLALAENTADVIDVAGNPVSDLDVGFDLISPTRVFKRKSRNFALIPHRDDFALTGGEISMSFTPQGTDRGTLFSKDHYQFGEGGHLTIRIRKGEIEVRLQSDRDSYYVRGGHLTSGGQHSVRFVFGDQGMSLFVDGSPRRYECVWRRARFLGRSGQHRGYRTRSVEDS